MFVSNVLNGTVTRLDLAIATKITVNRATVIASGYSFRTDPAAVVLGPTGLAFDQRPTPSTSHRPPTMLSSRFLTPAAEPDRQAPAL